MSLIFGTGDSDAFDGELIPDVGDISLPLYGKDNFTDISIDPQNFLKTRTLGLSPTNTTLTIKYRFGGGTDTNSGAEEIDSVANATFEMKDTSLDANIYRDVFNSFSVINTKPVIGGKDETPIEEIKELISANHASQNRCVTTEDFIVRALSMPSSFGSVFRANVQINPLNKNSVELVVLSRDNNGYVCVAPSDLKTNLKRYLSRFRMLTQGIDILDGKSINLSFNFGVLVDESFSSTEVLSNCLIVLKEYFDIRKWQMGQPIILDDIVKILDKVEGVISVFQKDFINRVGTFDGREYSSSVFNVEQNIEDGIIYTDSNSIFEIKYPNIDIRRSG